jgi:D,D-heptose 1,7-bisphosphate phosphatase
VTLEQAPRQCVILVGGQGTRLGSLTRDTPKPLLEVAGRPFLDTILWHVARFGFSRVVLLAGYRADKVVDYAAATPYGDSLEINVVVEPSPRGTGGALHFARDDLDETFLLINGDSVFDFNWLDLVPRLSAAPEAVAAMGLRWIDDASRFGVATLAAGKVTEFLERGGGNGGLVNGGVYLLRRSILDHLTEECSLERDVLPRLAEDGAITASRYEGFFLDIGVPQSFADAAILVPQSLRRPAIFLDRDGVLNVDYGHVGSIDRFEWMPTAVDAVKRANDGGYLVFVVTNQAGVAKGLYDETAVRTLHDYLRAQLRAHGAHIDDLRYCPFHPDGVVDGYIRASDWRKPAPGMLLDLLDHWEVDRAHSVLIGDHETDMEAARGARLEGNLFDGSRNLLDMVSSIVDN